MTTRKVMAEVLPQAEDEQIIYRFDFANIATILGAVVSINAVTIYSETDHVDTSATNLLGASSLLGNIISTPLVLDLEEKHLYRLTVSANFPLAQIVSAYILIKGER